MTQGRSPEPHTLAIIGAGVMGIGLAQRASLAKYDVLLVDNDQSVLDAAPVILRRNLRAAALLSGTASDLDDALARVTTHTDLSAAAVADIIVENVFERRDVKREVHVGLDEHVPEQTPIVINTSAIPIHVLAAHHRHPSRVIGVHFMNPVPQRDAVELIAAVKTSERTITRTREFLDRLGMKAIPVGDSCGFISNRVLMITINEATNLVEEGVGDATAVDNVFSECFGHAMGPLATADLIGLDTIRDSLLVLLDHFGNEKFRPSPLLERMVQSGRVGRKAGVGFYPYEGLGK